jgi:hypothetical protein
MLRENISNELVTYISRLDKTEQSSLLKQLRMRSVLLQARELDKKQKSSAKGKPRMSDDEIASIVRSIRRNVRSKA